MAGRKLSAYRRDDDDRRERAMSFFAPENTLDPRRGGDPALLAEILAQAPDRDLLVRFIALDASTAGKDPAFLEWFTAAIQ
jgi:hypothetical protein